MPYTKNDKEILEKVGKIIFQNGEVFVEHYCQRIDEKYYFIESLDDLKSLLNKVYEIDFVTIYKNKQLKLRGTLDNNFQGKALIEYSKMRNPNYVIFEYVLYPNELEEYGSGSNQHELAEELDELLGDYREENIQLCFGEDPRTIYRDSRTIYRKLDLKEDNEIIVISGDK